MLNDAQSQQILALATNFRHVWQNPAYLLAAIAVLSDTQLGKRILVTMPYADALFGVSDWFRQLWVLPNSSYHQY